MSLSQILSKLDLVQDDFPFLERCPAGLNQSGGAPQLVGRFADFALTAFFGPKWFERMSDDEHGACRDTHDPNSARDRSDEGQVHQNLIA